MESINNISQAEFNEFWAKIYEGQLSLFTLSEDALFLYNFTFDELDKALHKGWGKLKEGEQILQYEKAVNYRQNVARFSGVKTAHQADVLSAGVFNPDGTKRSFKEFKEIAKGVDHTFNKAYLKVEQDSAFIQSQNARQGMKILEEKDIFPFVQYVTVGDGRVRDSHAALDGLILRADDPRWDDIAPQNDWRCRCKRIQLRNATPTSSKEIVKKTRLINKDFRKNSDFKHNPAKVDYVFKENGKGKHEYFKVPREWAEAQKNNFGFPVPDKY